MRNYIAIGLGESILLVYADSPITLAAIKSYDLRTQEGLAVLTRLISTDRIRLRIRPKHSGSMWKPTAAGSIRALKKLNQLIKEINYEEEIQSHHALQRSESTQTLRVQG